MENLLIDAPKEFSEGVTLSKITDTDQQKLEATLGELRKQHYICILINADNVAYALTFSPELTGIGKEDYNERIIIDWVNSPAGIYFRDHSLKWVGIDPNDALYGLVIDKEEK